MTQPALQMRALACCGGLARTEISMPRRMLIDASQPQEHIAAEIWQAVCKRLNPETAPLTLEEITR